MRIRVSRSVYRIDLWVLILSLLLLRLPAALGYRQQPIVRLLFLSPIAILGLKNLSVLLIKSRIRFNKQLIIVFLVFCLILSVAFIRTSIYQTFPTTTVLGNLFVWLTMAVFGFTLFSSAPDEEARITYRRGVFGAIFLYLIFNAGLYFMGFQSPQEYFQTSSGRAALLDSIGINANRVLFPTAGGINSFGITAGIGLIAGITILLTPKSGSFDRTLALIGAPVSLTIMLLTDSRGALAYALLVFALILALPRISVRFLRWLPIFTPLLPIIMIYLLSLLPPSIVASLSRSGSDLANMSNRLIIWDFVIRELSDFKWMHFIGFGYRGQVQSGLALSYAHLFSSYTASDIETAHNFLLQSIIEIGYLGAGVLILLLFNLMGKLARIARKVRNDYTPKAMLFVLVFLVMAGITEAVFSPDFQEIFTVFILIWAATGSLSYVTAPRRVAADPQQLPSRPVLEGVR